MLYIPDESAIYGFIFIDPSVLMEPNTGFSAETCREFGYQISVGIAIFKHSDEVWNGR